MTETTEAFYLLGGKGNLVDICLVLEELAGPEGWTVRSSLPFISWDEVEVGVEGVLGGLVHGAVKCD